MTEHKSQDDEGIDIGQILWTLWRGKTVIVLTTVMGLCIGVLFTANTNPTYKADALLQLEEKVGSLALPQSLSAIVEADPRSVTEIEVLRSRMVLGQAVADQNLDWLVEPVKLPIFGTMFSRYDFSMIDHLVPSQFSRQGDYVHLAHLVVPPSWLDKDMRLSVEDNQRYILELPDGQIVKGRVGDQLAIEDLGFSITIDTISAKHGRQFIIQQVSEIRAISSLQSRLAINERGRASGILEIVLIGVHPVDNVRALDAIVQAYLKQNVKRSAAEAESSLIFIREQLPKAEQNLRDAEVALNDFRQQQVTIDLPLETQSILDQISSVEEQLAELARREDELRQRYTPAHPTYSALIDDRKRVEKRLSELRTQVANLPETQRQILNLTRAVELAQKIYTELLTRAQEVQVLRASSIGNVRIIDVASAASQPISPSKPRIFILVALLGAVSGMLLVIAHYKTRKGIKDSYEIESLNLPVFATINYNKTIDTSGKRRGKLPILAVEEPNDPTVEAIRSLRTSLYFGMLDARSPTLCITSAHPGAGKSFLALNLAVVAARAGQRVCLIDTDMRRGQLRRHFGVPRTQPGLAEVISGQHAIEVALLRNVMDNLSLLPTGKYPPNPSELLMRTAFSNTLEWCGNNFDLVICDTAPTLSVTDPVIVARNTGATIFVARHDITQRAEVEATMKSFTAAGVRLSGAVLNAFDPRKVRSRYGYGYGYGYGYRYDYKTRNE